MREVARVMEHVRSLRGLFPRFAALSPFGACGRASPDHPPPNVLLLVMDTTRGDRVSLDGRYHLIRCSDGREELYDVASDPRESRNLAVAPAEHAGVLMRLRALIPPP